MGCLEDTYHHVVDGVAVFIFYFSVVEGVGLGIGQGFAAGCGENLVGDGNGVVATESDDSDGAASGCCQGTDTFFLIPFYFSLNSI